MGPPGPLILLNSEGTTGGSPTLDPCSSPTLPPIHPSSPRAPLLPTAPGQVLRGGERWSSPGPILPDQERARAGLATERRWQEAQEARVPCLSPGLPTRPLLSPQALWFPWATDQVGRRQTPGVLGRGGDGGGSSPAASLQASVRAGS